MREKKIYIEIKDNGEIFSETSGIEGQLCIEELEKLFEDIGEFEILQRTPDYYKKKKKMIYQTRKK